MSNCRRTGAGRNDTLSADKEVCELATVATGFGVSNCQFLEMASPTPVMRHSNLLLFIGNALTSMRVSSSPNHSFLHFRPCAI